MCNSLSFLNWVEALSIEIRVLYLDMSINVGGVMQITCNGGSLNICTELSNVNDWNTSEQTVNDEEDL